MPTLKNGLNWKDQRAVVRMNNEGTELARMALRVGATTKAVQRFLDSLKDKPELAEKLGSATGGGASRDMAEGEPG